jgi:hypothetical protein
MHQQGASAYPDDVHRRQKSFLLIYSKNNGKTEGNKSMQDLSLLTLRVNKLWFQEALEWQNGLILPYAEYRIDRKRGIHFEPRP